MVSKKNDNSEELLEAILRIEERQRISSLDALYLLIIPTLFFVWGITLNITSKIFNYESISLIGIIGISISILVPVLYYCKGIWSESIEKRVRAFDYTLPFFSSAIGTLIFIGIVEAIKLFRGFPNLAVIVIYLIGIQQITPYLRNYFMSRHIVGGYIRRIKLPRENLEEMARKYTKRYKDESPYHLLLSLSLLIIGTIVLLFVEDVLIGLLLGFSLGLVSFFLLIFSYRFLKKRL